MNLYLRWMVRKPLACLLAAVAFGPLAHAQVDTTFVPTSTFEAGESGTFFWQIIATDHPSPLFPFGSGPYIDSYSLSVDYGDGFSETIFSGSFGFPVAASFFDHAYGADGTYTVTATVAGIWATNASLVGTGTTITLTDTFTVVDQLALSVTTPIPEPETYAMLLAGLGLLGFAARRRKRPVSATA